MTAATFASGRRYSLANRAGRHRSVDATVPAGVPPENQKWETEPGDVGFFVPGSICFYYGRLRVITPGNTFARVVENWPGLYRMCKASWKDHHIPVSIERA